MYAAKKWKLALCRRTTSREGTTCVEFALVIPIVLLFFFSAIEFARLNFLIHTAGNAAYEGARELIVVDGTEQDARTAVEHVLTSTRTGNGAEIDIEEWVDRVSVTVSLPVDQNSWGVGRFTSGLTITKSCTLMREVLKNNL